VSTKKNSIAALILVGVPLLFFAVFGIKGCASQSGMFSRWTGSAVELPVPEDCVRVLSLGKTGSTKYLSYINAKGEVVMHEYSDYGLLEATYKLDGATFDTNGVLMTAPTLDSEKSSEK
jgi:hypothetical protein